MRKNALQLVTALTLASTAAHAALPGSVSGTWYNLTQNGHGISLEILEGNRAVAIWHVFDPQGQPLTLYIDGRIEGRSILGNAYAPRGMRFGEFSASTLQLPTWGTVRIDVRSCESANLQWNALDAAFGQGSMDLLALSRPAGSECVLPPDNDLPFGLYHGQTLASAQRPEMRMEGLMDADGRLWAFERAYIGGQPLTICGPSCVTAFVTRVLRTEPVRVEPSRVVMRTATFGAHAFWTTLTATVDSGIGGFGPDGTGSIEPSQSFSYVNARSTWQGGAADGNTLVTGVDGSSLAGSYALTLDGQFVDFATTLRIDSDGSACFVYDNEPDRCEFAGRVLAGEGASGVLDFDLRNQRETALAPFRGRGWLQDTARGRELVLVGDNGTQGLLVLGLRR